MGQRLIDNPVMFFRDGRVFLELRLGGCRRQASKRWRSVLTAPVQNRCAAKNNGGPFRARSEQHRQHAENHIVADDDFGREVPQNLPQAILLSWEGAEKKAPYRTPNPRGPGGMFFSSGTTERRSRRSKSAAAGSGRNSAPMPSMGSRSALPDKPTTSWPSSIKMRPIVSSGLRWPVAGVEAMRIFTRSSHSDCRKSAAMATSSVDLTNWLEQRRSWGIAVTLRLRIGPKWLQLQRASRTLAVI